MTIHSDHPFLDDPDSWDPVRRFRGRLSSPVTIITTGEEGRRAGLTVSSLMVIEGEPGQVQAVVGPSTDLWYALEPGGRLIVHVCSERHRPLAETFAGLRPSPGGMFTGLGITQTDWGPVIEDLPNRAYCSLETRGETGFSGIMTATIDRVEVGDLTDPLTYFRGSYHGLD